MHKRKKNIHSKDLLHLIQVSDGEKEIQILVGSTFCFHRMQFKNTEYQSPRWVRVLHVILQCCQYLSADTVEELGDFEMIKVLFLYMPGGAEEPQKNHFGHPKSSMLHRTNKQI
jgi:hypothetical protein